MKRIVHFCYAGTSGSTRVALNISRGSEHPDRHLYVFYGIETLREDYRSELEARCCRWVYVPKRPGLDLRCYKASARAIVELEPGVVFFHGVRSLPVELRLRAMRSLPVVAVQHGPVELDRLGQKMACVAFGALARQTVAVSPSVAGRLRASRLLRWASEPLGIIQSGVDEGFWRPRDSVTPADTGPPQTAPPGEWIVGMIGTLERYKDQPTLIRALARLRGQGLPVRLELAGGGSLMANLRQQASSLGVAEDVRFLGDVSQEQVRQALWRWDVLVHSTYSEGLSMALLEGMMAARPVVASDVPGVQEVICHGQTGLLFPQGDALALAAAIQNLLENRELAKRLGEAARQNAAGDFSLKKMARDYEQLAERL